MGNRLSISDFTERNDGPLSDTDIDLIIAYAENRLEKKADRNFRLRMAEEPALRSALAGLITDTRGTEYEKILQQKAEDQNRFIKFWSDIADASLVFARQQKMYFISGFAAAVTACLIVFLFRGPGVPDQITESYRTAFVSEIKLGQDAVRLPWEGPGQYGFSPADRNGPAYRAFGAGLWSGRRELEGRISGDSETAMPDFLSLEKEGADKWEETRWRIYFRMGRWAFLMRTVCRSDAEVPDGFWEKQRELAEKIYNGFAEVPGKNPEDAGIVNLFIRSVGSALENPEAVSFGRRRQIARDIELLIKHLSPDRIPRK